jgi:hypothetical protein
MDRLFLPVLPFAHYCYAPHTALSVSVRVRSVSTYYHLCACFTAVTLLYLLFVLTFLLLDFNALCIVLCSLPPIASHSVIPAYSQEDTQMSPIQHNDGLIVTPRPVPCPDFELPSMVTSDDFWEGAFRREVQRNRETSSSSSFSSSSSSRNNGSSMREEKGGQDGEGEDVGDAALSFTPSLSSSIPMLSSSESLHVHSSERNGDRNSYRDREGNEKESVITIERQKVSAFTAVYHLLLLLSYLIDLYWGTLHALPCHALSCPDVSCPALSCPVLSCPAMPILPCHAYLALPCPTLPCHALPCPVLSCPAMPCHVPCSALLCLAEYLLSVLHCLNLTLLYYIILYCSLLYSTVRYVSSGFTVSIIYCLLSIHHAYSYRLHSTPLLFCDDCWSSDHDRPVALPPERQGHDH